MSTKDEDLKILQYKGLLGHELVGISGEPGARRCSCEVNDIASAKRLDSSPTLTVYRRGDRRKKNHWLSVYDRAAEILGNEIKKANGWPEGF